MKTTHLILGAMALATIGALTLAAAADVESLTQHARASLKQARANESFQGLADADDAVRQALQLSPQDFNGRKLEVHVLLARHRFPEALALARSLNHDVPDDVEGWGLVSDAALGLGDYQESERAAQWMLNLRSTNVSGLERGARLRELFGDPDGAREFWESALRLSLVDEEERAWIATQLASLLRRTGHADRAETLIGQVLAAVPAYQPALAEMARVRIEQRRYREAIELLEAHYKKAPRPDVQYELACVLDMAGRGAEAQTAFQEFERSARAHIDEPYNYNRELALYYADHTANAGEALRVAKIEVERRQDVETLDVYAWALYIAGDLAESQKQMDKALAVGAREAGLLSHAEAIAAKRKVAPHAD